MIVVCCRMMESQAGRMESLPRHALGCAAIEGITQHGVAFRGHVNANLVGSSGGERALEKCRSVAPAALCPVAGQCRFATCADDCHALAVAGVAPDGAGDISGWRKHAPPDKGNVLPGDAAAGERRRESDVGFVCLGDDHQTAGILVEAVNDAGACLAADAGKGVPAVGEQCMDEGSTGMAGARMDHEPGRLVDDEQVLVLMDDDQRNVLRYQGRIGWPWYRKYKMVAWFDPQGCLRYRPPAACEAAFLDEGLDPGSRQVRKDVGEDPVNPVSRLLGSDGVFEHPRHGTPLNPEVLSGTRMERSQAMIKAVVIGLGVLIVVLTGILVAGVLDRVGDTTAASDHRDGAVALPSGSRVLSITSDDDRLSLLLELASGSQAILIIDGLTGEPLSTLELLPRP